MTKKNQLPKDVRCHRNFNLMPNGSKHVFQYKYEAIKTILFFHVYFFHLFVEKCFLVKFIFLKLYV